MLERTKQDKQKLADSLKHYIYLLGQTDVFKHFLGDEILELIAQANIKKNGKLKFSDSGRYRKSEAEEDAELIRDENKEENVTKVFTESPSYIKKGTMRDYQLQGLNWMISLYENGVNGILADEMGLGKTLQTISFLGYLRYYRFIHGPHLIVVPKSTLHNWCNEFQTWIPEFKVFLFHGNKEERASSIQKELYPQTFDVCITSYEMCLRERNALKKIDWVYIIIDEAHRIKNENSSLSQIVRTFPSKHRLLITGTPLQNNLNELWALLNFLLPDIFHSADDFDAWFRTGEGNVEQLHKVLRPFLLRRVKSQVEKSLLPKKKINVYVGMSAMQRKWYQKILEKNIDAVNGACQQGKQNKTRLLNIVMQLRKCCNHPYLFDGAEPGPPYTTDQHLVQNAGKMIVLDRLLHKLKESGSRVLLFSQMSRVLDILEDYCVWKQWSYCRIDGNTPHSERIVNIDEFNAPNSKHFIFLLTTRAGGLGINLTSADTVILYDSDWNPQVDLQAEDRAHRIGQQKQVVVYRLVTENAIEEKVIERATQKLFLDKMVIQHTTRGPSSSSLDKETSSDYLAMIQHGAEAMFIDNSSDAFQSTTMDIEELLRKSEEKTAQLSAKYKDAKVEDLLRLNHSAYEWDGEDYRKKQTTDDWGKLKLGWIGPSKRERRTNSSVHDSSKLDKTSKTNKKLSKIKPPTIFDFQFYPKRLIDLFMQSYYSQLKEENAHLQEGIEEEEKKKIETAEPLTDLEKEEIPQLLEQAFANWTRKDFTNFLRACEKYGRHHFEAIAQEIETKTVDEVKTYASVFWERYKELSDGEKKVADIMKAEEKNRKQMEIGRMLVARVQSCQYPLAQLKLCYSQKARSKQFTEVEDRFLLIMLAKYGVLAEDVYQLIQEEIRQCPEFRFNWYMKSRTITDIGRRLNMLLSLIQKEDTSSTTAQPPMLASLDPNFKSSPSPIPSGNYTTSTPSSSSLIQSLYSNQVPSSITSIHSKKRGLEASPVPSPTNHFIHETSPLSKKLKPN